MQRKRMGDAAELHATQQKQKKFQQKFSVTEYAASLSAV